MAVESYATLADYYRFIGEDGGEATLVDAEVLRLEGVLRRATARVSRDSRFGRYKINPADGFPLSAEVRLAFVNATCAQAQWFEGKGTMTGAETEFDSVGMAGVVLSKRAGSAAATSVAETRIAPEAMEYLVNANIFSTRVASR